MKKYGPQENARPRWNQHSPERGYREGNRSSTCYDRDVEGSSDHWHDERTPQRGRDRTNVSDRDSDRSRHPLPERPDHLPPPLYHLQRSPERASFSSYHQPPIDDRRRTMGGGYHDWDDPRRQEDLSDRRKGKRKESWGAGGDSWETRNSLDGESSASRRGWFGQKHQSHSVERTRDAGWGGMRSDPMPGAGEADGGRRPPKASPAFVDSGWNTGAPAASRWNSPEKTYAPTGNWAAAAEGSWGGDSGAGWGTGAGWAGNSDDWGAPPSSEKENPAEGRGASVVGGWGDAQPPTSQSGSWGATLPADSNASFTLPETSPGAGSSVRHDSPAPVASTSAVEPSFAQGTVTRPAPRSAWGTSNSRGLGNQHSTSPDTPLGHSPLSNLSPGRIQLDSAPSPAATPVASAPPNLPSTFSQSSPQPVPPRDHSRSLSISSATSSNTSKLIRLCPIILPHCIQAVKKDPSVPENLKESEAFSVAVRLTVDHADVLEGLDGPELARKVGELIAAKKGEANNTPMEEENSRVHISNPVSSSPRAISPVTNPPAEHRPPSVALAPAHDAHLIPTISALPSQQEEIMDVDSDPDDPNVLARWTCVTRCSHGSFAFPFARSAIPAGSKVVLICQSPEAGGPTTLYNDRLQYWQVFTAIVNRGTEKEEVHLIPPTRQSRYTINQDLTVDITKNVVEGQNQVGFKRMLLIGGLTGFTFTVKLLG